jgi:hypothetical protein
VIHQENVLHVVQLARKSLLVLRLVAVVLVVRWLQLVLAHVRVVAHLLVQAVEVNSKLNTSSITINISDYLILYSKEMLELSHYQGGQG